MTDIQQLATLSRERWSIDRDAILRDLWLRGDSASMIANALGHVTRNAVIGRAYRIGLPKRASGRYGGRSPGYKKGSIPGQAPLLDTDDAAPTVTKLRPKVRVAMPRKRWTGQEVVAEPVERGYRRLSAYQPERVAARRRLELILDERTLFRTDVVRCVCGKPGRPHCAKHAAIVARVLG